VDLSKTGSSWTVGGKGASVNLTCEKVTGKVGIPGIGGMDLPSPPLLFALYALAYLVAASSLILMRSADPGHRIELLLMR